MGVGLGYTKDLYGIDDSQKLPARYLEQPEKNPCEQVLREIYNILKDYFKEEG